MRDFDSIFHLLDQFMSMAYSACRLSMWCMNLHGKLFYSSCPEEQSFLMLLNLNGGLDFALSDDRRRDRPVYLSDQMGLMYIADYLTGSEKAPDLMILMGPFFSSESSGKGIRDALRRQNLSPQLSIRLLRVLHMLPVLNRDMQDHYAAMLHCVVTGGPVTTLHPEFQHSVKEQESFGRFEGEEGEEEKLARVSRKSQERVFQAIREGNIHIREQLDAEEQSAPTMRDIVHYGTKATGRDEKNSSIINAALCAQAAIEGGLDSVVAEKIRKEYISEIERAKTVTDLYELGERMTREFIAEVDAARKESSLLSGTVQRICAYVHEHIEEQIELDALADAVHYSKYYLTKKFQKEMGMRLSDYIFQEKIELAKILLMTTELPVQDISDKLSFSSRSYFNRVFRKQTGISPQSYRNRRMG